MGNSREQAGLPLPSHPMQTMSLGITDPGPAWPRLPQHHPPTSLEEQQPHRSRLPRETPNDKQLSSVTLGEKRCGNRICRKPKLPQPVCLPDVINLLEHLSFYLKSKLSIFIIFLKKTCKHCKIWRIIYNLKRLIKIIGLVRTINTNPSTPHHEKRNCYKNIKK